MKQITGLLILIGAAALAACASQAPATATATGASHESVSVKESTTPQGHRAEVPTGYRRIVKSDGSERFCRTDLVTGSRAERVQTCYTAAELAAMEDNSRDFVQGVQRSGGTNASNPCLPGKGGAMGGAPC